MLDISPLRAAGLASEIDDDRFRDACLAEWRAERAVWPDEDGEDGEPEEDGEDGEPKTVEAFEAATLLAALASLYGTHGPTDTSAAEGIFFLDERAAEDPEVWARVQAVLVRWLGRPLSAQLTVGLDSMVYYVGDALYLRRHAGDPGAAALFASEGVRATDDLAFTGFSPRVSPDTEAAALGIFRARRLRAGLRGACAHVRRVPGEPRGPGTYEPAAAGLRRARRAVTAGVTRSRCPRLTTAAHRGERPRTSAPSTALPRSPHARWDPGMTPRSAQHQALRGDLHTVGIGLEELLEISLARLA